MLSGPPGAGLSVEVAGFGVPVDQAVMNVFCVWLAAVMCRTTAATPDVGTPPRPAMRTLRVVAGPNGPAPSSSPSMVDAPGRVSSSRAGVMAT